jgi:hypothetical protein
MSCWRHIVLLASVLMLVLLLVSLLFGILAVAGLHSVVDTVKFLLSLLHCSWPPSMVLLFTVFASIPAFDCVHTACVGATVVAYIPAVACLPAVGSYHDIAGSLMLLVADVTVVASDCCCLHPDCGRHSCCSGVLEVPEGFLLLVNLLLLMFLV